MTVDQHTAGAIDSDNDNDSHRCSFASAASPAGTWHITTNDRSLLGALLDIVVVVPFHGTLTWN